MESFHIVTFGCQMNEHDSERLAGLLASEGYAPADDPHDADVVVFNTCCVRENAEERLRGRVTSLADLKRERPGLLIAVGGCIGQRDRARLLTTLPQVDVVFGTHNLAELPRLLGRAREAGSAAASVRDAADEFASELPSIRKTAWRAWLPIAVGCDNHCSYCVVPRVRGPERSRDLDSIVAEARSLVDDGVLEIVLLGQNVNSYGRDLYGEPRFAEVLERVAATGVDRLRFTTSHPKDLSEGTLRAMASTRAVCPSLHLPVQSGSTRVLGQMRRQYTHDSYLDLVDRAYRLVPDLALSTDIMVGFPGETEQDFLDTLDVVEKAAYDQAFTFIFSPREGTPAAAMPDQVPRDVAQDRFDRLVGAIRRSATAKNAALEGTVQRVLVEGPSKRDPDRLLGRSAANKVVHAPPPGGISPESLAGTFLDVLVEKGHTWFLEGTVRA